jgi:translation elongation factor EF-G
VLRTISRGYGRSGQDAGVNWDEDSLGMKFEYVDIPADLRADCEAWREKMVEAAAEASDELMENIWKVTP